ncbi:hypothetical protein MHI24_19890 [Paenibacillus sp. FSL K6-1096]|uniref:hypothetical protein n=1 Tax=Paenibacillus sp. FSL K6-1096 TaxID=2921460 RepID=UPI0030EED29C
MLNIAPVKSTPYPKLRSCIDDCIQAVAEWQGTDSKCMYGHAWQMSFAEEQSPGQLLAERLVLPRIDTGAMASYHGLIFNYIERQGPERSREFLLDMLESRLSAGMPVLVGFDSYDCPWCVAYRRLHTSHACLAVGLDRPGNIIYLTDAYYDKPLEAVDFDVLEQACSFYALFELCPPSRSYTDWQTTLQEMLDCPAGQLQPGGVTANLQAYADAYLEAGLGSDPSPEADSRFKVYANALPISRIRFGLFLELLNREARLPGLASLSERYLKTGEEWNLLHQFMLQIRLTGNKPSARAKIHKRMGRIISQEEQLLEECVQLAVQAGTCL